MKISAGYHRIISEGGKVSEYECKTEFTKPNEIYINGKNQSIIQPFYQFYEEENYVKLVWKVPVTDCGGIFCNCGHILELNLSHFNSSQVTNMKKMFQDCHLLTSIDLSNVETSKSTFINAMFYNCYLLKSLDLSRFETSICTNFGHMFCNCASLKEINISHFNK